MRDFTCEVMTNNGLWSLKGRLNRTLLLEGCREAQAGICGQLCRIRGKRRHGMEWSGDGQVNTGKMGKASMLRWNCPGMGGGTDVYIQGEK